MDREIRQLLKETDANPSNALGWYRLGIAQQARGEDARASAALCTALRCAPEDPTLCVSIGDALLALGSADSALESFQRACALRPEDVTPYARIGTLHLEGNAVGEALKHLEVAHSLAPDDESIQLSLSRALIDAGRISEAEPYLKHLVAADERNPEPLELLSRVARSRGDLAQAIQWLETALQIAPGDAATKTSLGTLLADQGACERAIALLEQVAAEFPESADALLNLGMALHAAGRSEEALGYLAQAIRLDSESAAAHSNYGIVLQATGNLERALASFHTAAALAPTWPVAHFNLGVALEAAGSSEAAKGALDRARELAAGNETLLMQVDSVASKIPLVATQDSSTFSGNLKTFALPDVLEFLRINRRSGKLNVTAPQGAAELYLTEGQMAGLAGTSAPTLRERLALMDVHTEAIHRITAADPTMPDHVLAAALWAEGAVDETTLRRELRSQMEEGLLEALKWDDGVFAFELFETLPEQDGVQAQREEEWGELMELEPSPHAESPTSAPMTFDVGELLLDAIRRMDEERR